MKKIKNLFLDLELLECLSLLSRRVRAGKKAFKKGRCQVKSCKFIKCPLWTNHSKKELTK